MNQNGPAPVQRAMAEPYRAPPDERPRWSLTCWPRVSFWPAVVALVASVPCVVLGWQGSPEAQVLACSPNEVPSRRCTITPAGSSAGPQIASCERLHEQLPAPASLTHFAVMRQRTEPFVANTSNVFVNGAPVVIARADKDWPAEGRLEEPHEGLRACAAGEATPAIEIEVHRRTLWLLGAPLLGLVLAMRWMIGKRVRVILDPGVRTARVVRLGHARSATVVTLDDTTRPGWVQLGDTEHEGFLDDAGTRRRLARWLAARVV